MNTDPHYVARRYNTSKDVTVPVKPSKVWEQGVGITQEKGYKGVTIYSRDGLRFPRLIARNPQGLPDFSDLYNADFYMGFQLGGDGNLATFRWKENNVMQCVIRDWTMVQPIEITNLLPSDYLTGETRYEVKVNRASVEFRINHVLKCVVVSAKGVLGNRITVSENSEPYSVGVFESDLPDIMPVLTSLMVEDPEGEVPEFTHLMSPGEFRWSEGSPCPPRTFRLYDWEADTLMTSGTYDTGTSYKSHPVPTAGYDGKTLLFRADTDSASDGLRVEVLTQEGNWRLYDSLTYSAGDLEYYGISADLPLVRIGYEPASDGASITDAEVQLQ